MKVIYKGHEIAVTREMSLGGWPTLYYSIFRVSDGYECTSGFEASTEKVKDMMKNMKRRVDRELSEDDPWYERGCEQ